MFQVHDTMMVMLSVPWCRWLKVIGMYLMYFHSYLISHTSVRHFLHLHCHHPLLLLSFTPGSKLILSDLSHTSVRHFLHLHCHHPLLLLSFTPGSKLIFSTNRFLHSSSIFSPTKLTPWTPAVFRFHWTCQFLLWHSVLG